jgi:hypothetical protein
MKSNNDNSSRSSARPDGERSADGAVAHHILDVSECGLCGCDMVYPIDWDQVDGNTWRVTLRCPNCEEVGNSVMGEELIEEYDGILDRGTDSLVRDLRNLTYANMATEINTFVDALQGDYILPEDF